jgi:hypothetical protein
MPPYRFHVRTTQGADDQLLDLLVRHPKLRNAISRASHHIDLVLGIGPPNQGNAQPLPGYPNRRAMAISLLLVGFHYDSNGVEVVVTSIELNPLPPHGPP